MDELLARLLVSQLQRLGGSISPRSAAGERRAFKAASGLLDAYDRWFEAALGLLADRYHHSAVDVDTAWAEWERCKAAWLDDPDRAAHVTLVERTLRALPDILTGKCRATEVIFPESSMALVEGIYQNNPVADFFNEVLADAVIAYIQACRQGRRNVSDGLRILEIGAGTGGTSAMIFQKLQSGRPPYREQVAEYCYTDISRAFLMHAERQYAPSNPYLTCRLFNVEAPIAGQGIPAGAYDLVIAANVLHATRDIRQTLRNAKAVLKNHGLILLNELARNTLFTHLTFGLLDGWWLYEDAELRLPGCPGLSSHSWQKVLEQEGFHSVMFPVQAAHDLGCQIIVAESDGIVRQARERTAHGGAAAIDDAGGRRGRAASSGGVDNRQRPRATHPARTNHRLSQEHGWGDAENPRAQARRVPAPGKIRHRFYSGRADDQRPA